MDDTSQILSVFIYDSAIHVFLFRSNYTSKLFLLIFNTKFSGTYRKSQLIDIKI